MQKIYLGSNSPRRLQLLQQLGLSVEVLKGEIDETVAENETTGDYVLRMALSKNQQIRHLFPTAQIHNEPPLPVCNGWLQADAAGAAKQQGEIVRQVHERDGKLQIIPFLRRRDRSA